MLAYLAKEFEMSQRVAGIMGKIKDSGKVCDHRPLRDAHSPRVDSTGKRSVRRQAYDFLAGNYVMTPRASVTASLKVYPE